MNTNGFAATMPHRKGYPQDLKLAELPTSLAATHRGFAFYVADPINSIRRFPQIAEANKTALS